MQSFSLHLTLGIPRLLHIGQVMSCAVCDVLTQPKSSEMYRVVQALLLTACPPKS